MFNKLRKECSFDKSRYKIGCNSCSQAKEYNKAIDDCEKILAEKVEEVKNNIIKLKKLNCGICGNQLNHRSDKVLNFAVPRNDVEKEIDKIFKSEAKQ